ncbi:MAG: hypothetical protein IKB96_04350 [Prevotella sp.]|nr:hypothetical protein [Prevotella sp.]
MNRIMFSDKYGLTDAVLARRKTMTRRIIPPIEIDWNRRGKVTLPISGYKHGALWMDCRQFLPDSSPFDYVAPQKYQPHYSVGEEVAIAQSYRNIIAAITPSFGSPHAYDDLRDKPGWNNKMFVRADLMPHRIKITGIKLERLQDISEEDIYKEGFEKQSVNNGWGNAAWHWETMLTYMDDLGLYKEIRSVNPQEAFECLIDKLSGYGTWESNPWVYAYEFELIK